MSWQVYEVVLRLCSPLHIGCGKIGNLQRTRPHVTGRVIWGALTMRLTRDMTAHGVAAADSGKYQEIGNEVHENLAFSYFYPALLSENENTYQVIWPWEQEKSFRYRFLSSYAGTALSYPQKSADEGMLHETEFISPRTLDEGKQVYLRGYIFAKEGCSLCWKKSVERLQFGGERGYGWGDTKVEKICESKDGYLFDTEIKFREVAGKPSVYVPASKNQKLLAHTVAEGLAADGEVEPLVGREWRSNSKHNQYAGQHIEFNRICFAPGSILNDGSEDVGFWIDKFGIWEKSK